MTTHHNHSGDSDWGFSSKELDEAMQAVDAARPIDRSWDIPYVAGYSSDMSVIFIDRKMPPTWVYKGRSIDTDKYLQLHESVEDALMNTLGLSYQFGHQLALRCERAAVEADKVSWDVYDAYMQTWIAKLGHERPMSCPPNLDLRPYEAEHDTKVIAMIKAAMGKKGSPEPIRAANAPQPR